MNFFGFPYSNPSGNTVLSDGTASVVGNFPSYDTTSGVLISDSGYSNASFLTPAQAAAIYLPLTGGALTGDLDMKSNDLVDVALLNGVDADEFVSASDVVSVVDNIPVYYSTSAKRLKTSGVNISSLVPYTGATASVDVGTHTLYVKNTQPVVSAKFIQVGGANAVINTTTESNWFENTPDSRGSLVYAANGTQVGRTFRFTGHGNVQTLGGGSTITLRLKCTSGTFAVHTITPGLFAAPVGIKWETVSTSTNLGATWWTSSHISIDGLPNFVQVQYPFNSWNNTIAQTVAATVEFSVASNDNNFQSTIGVLESVWEA